ncbi:MAG: DMT family transporter [Clostridiaceae bacterium]|mgnify:CR=1 FL=1|nr:DMT family transporter [Clostridiaceae bacterium]
MKERNLSGHLMAIFCVIVWGSTFVVSKSLLTHMQPIQLMLIRFAIAYMAMWIIYPKWYFRLKEEWRFLLLGLMGNTLYAWTENTALTLTLVSNVSILVSTTPIMTALLVAIFYKDERLRRQQIFGFMMAFVGMVFVVYNGVVTLKLNPAGDILALLASLIWAIYGLLLRRWSDEYNSALMTRKMMFYGVLTTLPIFLMNKEPLHFLSAPAWENVFKLLYLGIVASAVCFLLWNMAIRSIGVLKTSLYIYSIPLVTLIISVILLDENITLMGIIGMLLIVTGMLLGTRQQKNKK